MKYFAETEKAVKLALVIEAILIERTMKREVWVPKSQLAADGRPGQWITEQKMSEIAGNWSVDFICWKDADGEEFGCGMTAREQEQEKARAERFEARKKAYAELIEKAKAAGVKGIRVGMKRATIEAKLAAIAC